MSGLHALYSKRKNLIGHNMDSYSLLPSIQGVMRFLRPPLTIDRLIVHDMHNVKIISLKEPFTDEFNGVLCVSCMSYIIALIFGQSQHRRMHQALYRWKEGVALNSICIVKWGKTLSLCGVNSFIFFVFLLVEGSVN